MTHFILSHVLMFVLCSAVVIFDPFTGNPRPKEAKPVEADRNARDIPFTSMGDSLLLRLPKKEVMNVTVPDKIGVVR